MSGQNNLCKVNEDILSSARDMAQGLKGAVPVFIIVPDRFTLQAEKLLLTGAGCLLNTRVLTFSMLFNVLNDSYNEQQSKVLDKTTAVLFMWRAIQSVRDELVYFGRSVDQYAFAEKMFNTINQLSSCMADFDNLANNASEDITRRKMQDIQTIHAKYKELTTGYTDSGGMLSWLISNIRTSEIVKQAHVYITGFEHISLQRAEVIRELMRHAKSFTVGARDGSEFKEMMDEIRFTM